MKEGGEVFDFPLNNVTKHSPQYDKGAGKKYKKNLKGEMVVMLCFVHPLHNQSEADQDMGQIQQQFISGLPISKKTQFFLLQKNGMDEIVFNIIECE